VLPEIVKDGLREADWWVAIFTGLLFTVTATLAWFTYRLWRETKRAVLDTAESRRPWLHFEITPISDVFSDQYNFVNVIMSVTNLGLSPAINVAIKSLLDPNIDLTPNAGSVFVVDERRFSEVESKLFSKERENFNFFSFPNQKMEHDLWLGSAKCDFKPAFTAGIAYVFIYYQTPGGPKIHCTKRAYIILPPDGPRLTVLARCIPCGENAE